MATMIRKTKTDREGIQINNPFKMADRILEFLSNLLKIGKEQLFLKSMLLRSKVPIKPVLGLTGLGVLFIAVRPLLSGKDSGNEIDSTISTGDKSDNEDQYSIKKTLYLMREKEKLLRKQEAAALEQKS